MVSEVPQDLPALCFYRRPPSGETVRLLAVGDIGLCGLVAATAQDRGYEALLEEFVPLFHGADIVFGNLETTLLETIRPGYLFAAAPSMLSVLQTAGFTVLHLANNHIYDYGQQGLLSTIAACQQYGIIPLGVGNDPLTLAEPVSTDCKGLRIGWLSCGRTLQKQAPGGPYYWEFNEDSLKEAIKRSRESFDVLIVSIHIGLMYLDYPHPDHKSMAEGLLAAGADLILMHHAHVLQGAAVNAAKQGVCYNLGNFLWDWQQGNVKPDVAIEEQQEGAVFLFDFDQDGLCQAAALPTVNAADCCVHWATGAKGDKILSRLKRLSEGLEQDYHDIFWGQRADRNVGMTIKVLLFHLFKGNIFYIYDQVKKFRWHHVLLMIRFILNYKWGK
jgi:poly-gamma-glutamate synthesis protein (capsule biosynthesis protein)